MGAIPPLKRGMPAALAVVGIVVGIVAGAGASGVGVVVDGRPLVLSPGPIERAGRVFVPLRGIFERLGASVVYHAGAVNATRGASTVALRIGSTVATVDGRPTYVDVAPFIVGATTYVPLRFVAQSFGAVVGYDGPARLVSVDLAREPVIPPRPLPPRPIPPRPVPPTVPPVSIVHLRALQPPASAFIQNRHPAISAEFTHRVDAGTVALSINGSDVTYAASRSAGGFTYVPRTAMHLGGHTVRVIGRDESGARFDRGWSFTIVPTPPPRPTPRPSPTPTPRPRPPTFAVTLSTPTQNQVVGRTFLVRGHTAPNAPVHIDAGPLSSPVGQAFQFLPEKFSRDLKAGPLGNFEENVTTAPGQGLGIGVIATATNPLTGATAQVARRLRGQ
jgi:hypothetical protein